MRETENKIAKQLTAAIKWMLLLLFAFLLTGLAAAAVAILSLGAMGSVMSCADGGCYFLAQLVVLPIAWVTLLVLTWFSLRVYRRM